jgi:hypothetical protein
MSRRRAAVLLSVVFLLTAVAAPATARTGHRFETTLMLPADFQPEGIAVGPGPVGYFRSRVDGDLYRVDLRTGCGRVFSQGPARRRWA